MKFDMGGSAAVLGAAKALGQIKPTGVEVDTFSFGDFLRAICSSVCCTSFITKYGYYSPSTSRPMLAKYIIYLKLDVYAGSLH